MVQSDESVLNQSSLQTLKHTGFSKPETAMAPWNSVKMEHYWKAIFCMQMQLSLNMNMASATVLLHVNCDILPLPAFHMSMTANM
ncbi:hypothetical protein V6N13_147791 [Hibiscus sabdariffa]|uniref:Uncharacterized protein n=1 Tax=Hibiscus sabdariffa TaxID=183260 RepID=A0ABR2TWX0_9ROSI